MVEKSGPERRAERPVGGCWGPSLPGPDPGRTLVQDLASPLTAFCFMNHSVSSEMEMIAEKTACLGAFIELSSYKYEL